MCSVNFDSVLCLKPLCASQSDDDTSSPLAQKASTFNTRVDTRRDGELRFLVSHPTMTVPMLVAVRSVSLPGLHWKRLKFPFVTLANCAAL